MTAASVKPLGMKAYGHIPHLPGSRRGPGDHGIEPAMADIATRKARPGDRIVVLEKLDGTCVSVAKIGGVSVPLIRAGYHARDSIWELHHEMADWVDANRARFDALLREGERACAEWLSVAHGTRYDLPHEPFGVFDIMVGHQRAPFAEVRERAAAQGFTTPHVISDGPPVSVAAAVGYLERFGSHHGAIDPPEGAVWRVERGGVVEFLCKYVRPDKNDRLYLRGADGSQLAPTRNRWPGCPA